MDESIRNDMVSDVNGEVSGTGSANEQSGVGDGQANVAVADVLNRLYSLLFASEETFQEVKAGLNPRLVDYLTAWTDIRVQVAQENLNTKTLKNLATLFFSLGFISSALLLSRELAENPEAVLGLSTAVMAVARDHISAELTSAGTDVPAGT